MLLWPDTPYTAEKFYYLTFRGRSSVSNLIQGYSPLSHVRKYESRNYSSRKNNVHAGYGMAVGYSCRSTSTNLFC